MSKVKIQGNASGTGVLTITAPNTSTDRTITLPDATATIATTTEVALKAPIASPEFTGNVGIGEQSVGAKLHVSHSDSSTDLTDANNIAAFERNGNARLVIATNSANTGSLEFGDSGGARQGRVSYAHSNDSMQFFTGGTQRLRVDADGLKFGTDTAAANALDDYEEGTWTAVFQANGSNITASYNGSQHKASYIKVGKMVTIFLQTRLPNCISNEFLVSAL